MHSGYYLYRVERPAALSSVHVTQEKTSLVSLGIVYNVDWTLDHGLQIKIENGRKRNKKNENE